MAAGDGVSKTIGRLLLVRSGLSKLIGRLWQSVNATGDDKRSTDPAVLIGATATAGNVCRPCVTTGGGSDRCVLMVVASVALNAPADVHVENTVLGGFSVLVLLKAVPFLDITLLLNGAAQCIRVTASLAGASVANRMSRISDVLIGSPLTCDAQATGALMMLTLGVEVAVKVLNTDAIGGDRPGWCSPAQAPD